MKFVQARHYTATGAARRIRLLVVHTMESAEKPTGAEAVANWFAGTTAPRASAHYCIDNNSIVQCVRDRDVAWAAPGANHDGLHFEHAGRAAQDRGDWADDFSTDELIRSARLVAKLAKKYNVPIKFLDAAAVRDGKKGITGHLQITRSGIGGAAGTHTDPGEHFPWARYLRYCRAFAAGRTPQRFTPQERKALGSNL